MLPAPTGWERRGKGAPGGGGGVGVIVCVGVGGEGEEGPLRTRERRPGGCSRSR